MGMLDIQWKKAEPNKWDHPRSERWEAKIGKQRIGRFEAEFYEKMDGGKWIHARWYSIVRQGCSKVNFSDFDEYDTEEMKAFVEDSYFTFLKNIGAL